MKKIIISADDYGQNTEISKGILDLAHKGRISATSCMTNLSQWPIFSKMLINASHIDRGVHLNFTYGSPISAELQKVIPNWPSSPLQILWLCLKNILNAERLQSEIEIQIEAFEQAIGQQIDFIDGHQHLHHFPFIQSALVSVYQKRYGHLPYNNKPYIRASFSKNIKRRESYRLKKHVINLSGSKTLRKKLIELNIPHNLSFGGIYDFNTQHSYQSFFEEAVSNMEFPLLWMCHPGLVSQDTTDPIRQARPQELKYLASSEFIDFCQNQNIEIEKFQKI